MRSSLAWLYWGGGWLASLALIWAISAVFLDSIVPLAWNETLGAFVRRPGITVRKRSEGWSTIPVGSMGMDRSDAIILKREEQVVAVWGDSHVESDQLPSRLRAISLYNRAHVSPKLIAFGAGGLSVADYYFRIPRVESALSNIVGNIIVLSGLEDITPDLDVNCHSRFLSNPWRFIESECKPSGLALKYAPILAKWRGEFVYRLYKDIRGYPLRFIPGKVVRRNVDETYVKTPDYESAWTFMLDAMKRQTTNWFAFIYLPHGIDIAAKHPSPPAREELLVEKFKDICLEREIPFIDLTPDFYRTYREKGAVLRGFFNTPPGSGHLNQNGHLLLSVGLSRAIAESTK